MNHRRFLSFTNAYGRLSIVVCAFLMAGTTLSAQTIVRDDWQQLQVQFTLPSIDYGTISLNGQPFTTLHVEGYQPSSEEGKPCLPTFSRLIEVPLCRDFETVVSGAEYDTLLLDAQLMPAQPPRSKSDTTTPRLVMDRQLYATDAFYGQESLVEPIGIARDRRLARLQFAPMRYNPVSGQLIVCRKATLTVRYLNADREATIQLFERHHSPAFASNAGVMNSLYPKSVRTAAPVRYLIVAHSSFRGQLDGFVQWKRRKGFLTDIVYTDSSAVGSTSTSIATYVQEQYTGATAANPAPTYLLLVGDHEQIPAFNAQVTSPSSSHITDLYYISWTSGDNLPDCHCGRFSAQTVAQLTPQIQKTLMYEQYTFADPSFLDRAVLVAGVDGGSSSDYGYTHADPAMDYAATHYINSTQGFTQVQYFKNNTSIVPSATGITIGSSASSNSATVRNYYNQGAGWINYSAHGSATSWGTPNFTTTHVASMTNTQKFGLMIGNCCLTNKFETTTCFGESLLRKDNYCGAVGYIGGSNSTYWNHDFYWAVGIRNTINATMSMAYDASNLGAYDRLCHTHGEAYSDWALTQAGIMFVGNLAVEASTTSSSYKHYYWEIYHLMGDPSVMPYLTQASVMTLSAPSVLVIGTTSLTVNAAPYAYVALTDTLTHTLVTAAYADSTGIVTLVLPPTLPLGGYELAASAQQYRTAFNPLSIIAPANAFPIVASVTAFSSLNAGDTASLLFALVNPGSSTAQNVSVTVTLSDNTALTLIPASNHLIDSLPAGDTLMFLWPAYVNLSVSDGTSILLTASTSWNGSTDPNVSTHAITLNAPAVSLHLTPTTGNIQPGDSLTLTATLTNRGHATLADGWLTLASPTRMLHLASATDSTALLTLAPSSATSISFRLQADSLLPSGIEIPLSLTVGNTAIPVRLQEEYTLYIGSNPQETFEGGIYHVSGWTQGTYPWAFDTANAYAGNYCLKSSTITHNQTAEVSFPITLDAADSIRFYYSVSSEASYDKFHFYIDNSDLLSQSGVVNWTRAAFLVPAGSHTLRFTYEKDVSVNRNSDCAWIDNVLLPHQTHPVQFRTDTICQGTLYVLDGDTLNTTVAGNGSHIDATSDTILLVDYTILPSAFSEQTYVACDSLLWNDSLYTASTLVSRHWATVGNCDSSVLIHLVVNPSFHNEQTLTACDSMLWNGRFYTASTDIAEQWSTVAGCDSTRVYHLSIHPSYYAEQDLTVCDSLLWNDSLYTASTDITDRWITVAGCDSVEVQHLVVNYSTLTIIHDTTFDSLYHWNDSVYTHSGIYQQVFSTVEGCDSTVLLMLTMRSGTLQGIEDLSTLHSPLFVYPNPTTGMLHLRSRVAELELYTLSGQQVLRLHDVQEADLGHLPQGVYLLRLTTSHATTVQRVVKQ